MLDPIARLIITLCLAVLFIAAALHKVRGRRVFADQLAAYGLLPQRLLGPAAFLLPGVEIALAACLLVPALTTRALYGSAALLAVYALAMGFALLRGRANIDCGCSGASGATSISNALIARNLFIVVAATLAATTATARALSLPDYGLVVLGVATFCVLYAAANQLMANGPNLKTIGAS